MSNEDSGSESSMDLLEKILDPLEWPFLLYGALRRFVRRKEQAAADTLRARHPNPSLR